MRTNFLPKEMINLCIDNIKNRNEKQVIESHCKRFLQKELLNAILEKHKTKT
eukprot:UN14950